jgi:glyoxylase-like metal-dependent hydrolase (beta-lactamase superfamily II)
MAAMEIHQIPVWDDNYVYLAHDPETGSTAVVDPADADPVLAAAEAKGWKITHILNTHHHPDHVGGNLEIKAATGCTVVGARSDAGRIPGIDVQVGQTDTYEMGSAVAKVFDVPGHTSGAYRLLVRGLGCSVLRRHAVRAGLRAAVRGHGGTDVALVGQVPRPTRLHARFLCP